MSTETKTKEAILSVLANVSNYPKEVQSSLWGADVANLTEKVYQALMESGVIERIDVAYGRPLVDRVEVIDASGRAYVNMDAVDVVTALQDRGKTLKVFVGEKL
jgi:hypothetical protein